MTDRHRTTTAIPRPRGASQPPADRGAVAERFAEFTLPIANDRLLVKGRVKRLALALVGVVIVAALAASLFVLPVKSWLQQRDDLARKQNELAVLTNANAQLAGDVNRLNTPDGIKEAARQEVGYIGVGEQRISVMATPNAPLTLPAGWPYDAITQIVAVRSAAAVIPAP